jgi:phosphoglycolate phosphatase
VPYGYNEGQDVRGLEADAIVASIEEAAKLVTRA